MAPRSHGSLRLALAFAALGAALGAQIAGLLRVGCFTHDGPLWTALVVLVPITLAVVGVVVARNAHRRVLPFASVALVTLPSGGMLLGVLIGILWWPPDGILAGAHDGLLLGLAGVPFLVPLFLAARDAGRARESSLLDRVDGYGVWASVGASCALSSVATLPRWNVYPRCSVAAGWLQTSSGLVGVGCALAGLLLTVCMWVAQRAASARILRLRAAPVAKGAPCPMLVDLGLGDAHWERETTVATAYRSVLAAELVVRGDVATTYAAAVRSARRTVVLGIVAAVAAVVCLLVNG